MVTTIVSDKAETLPITIPTPMRTHRLDGSLQCRRGFSTHLSPQTCGKVERFHQTLKKYLAKQEPAQTKKQLQVQLDRFVAYYNQVRPHRAIGRRTPLEAFEAPRAELPAQPFDRLQWLQGPERQGRQARLGDTSAQWASPPHRSRTDVLRLAGGHARRGSRHPDHRLRPVTAPPSDSRPERRLPTTALDSGPNSLSTMS